MKNSKIVLISFLNAVGTAIYITGVVFLISNAEKIFGKIDNFGGPIALLLLFVMSAAITGALVLGRPILLYLEGMKIEAIKMFLYSVGWLLIMTIIAFAVQVFIKNNFSLGFSLEKTLEIKNIIII